MAVRGMCNWFAVRDHPDQAREVDDVRANFAVICLDGLRELNSEAAANG